MTSRRRRLAGSKYIESLNSKYWPETNLLSEFFDDYTDLLSDLRWRVAHGYAVQTFDLVGAASHDSQKAFQRRHSVLSGLQSRADEREFEQQKDMARWREANARRKEDKEKLIARQRWLKEQNEELFEQDQRIEQDRRRWAQDQKEEQEKQNDLQWIWLITERLVKELGRDPEQAYKQARAAVDEYWDQNPGADRSSRHRITIK